MYSSDGQLLSSLFVIIWNSSRLSLQSLSNFFLQSEGNNYGNAPIIDLFFDNC